ncbi:MAG TPA: slipin family protein [Candidatus Acidoferrum sp.]|nr:slipin family protein [Candidatus Acidoferrum sp.]
MPGAVLIAAIAVLLVVLLIVRWGLFRVTIMEYQSGLLYQNGRFQRLLKPGRYWLFRPTHTVAHVDIRPRLASVTGQEVVTADGVSMKLSLACRYVVVQPDVAINKVEDFQQALYQVLQLALREIVSTSTGDELLRGRREIGERLMSLAAKPAEEFGLQLQSVNLKDITFPGDLKKIYSQVVLAQKEGQAALERARGETAALRNLANAARMVHENPSLMQLRLVQQLGTSSGNTIILGIPTTSSPIPIVTKEGKAEPPPLPSPPEE